MHLSENNLLMQQRLSDGKEVAFFLRGGNLIVAGEMAKSYQKQWKLYLLILFRYDD